MRLFVFAVSLLVMTVSMSACSDPKGTVNPYMEKSISEIRADQWDALTRAKIYFGHKSVGEGIVMGMQDLMKDYPGIRINIVGSSSSGYLGNGAFLHSPIGSNRKPESKMEDFQNKLKDGLGENLDIAILKFCWADIMPNTDVAEVFNNYKAMVRSLSESYPNLRLIHVTVPLTSNGAGFSRFIKKIKDIIKIIIGKLNYYDNERRNEFNEMMRKEYSGKAPLFDLALIQNGSGQDGLTDPMSQSLSPEFTDDGGHLNLIGQRVVAEKWFVFLAETVKK